MRSGKRLGVDTGQSKQTFGYGCEACQRALESQPEMETCGPASPHSQVWIRPIGPTDGDDVQRKVIKSAMAENARTKAWRNSNPSWPPSEGRKGERRSRRRKKETQRRLLGHGGKGARIPS